jgi:hypothetical protein
MTLSSSLCLNVTLEEKLSQVALYEILTAKKEDLGATYAHWYMVPLFLGLLRRDS